VIADLPSRQSSAFPNSFRFLSNSFRSPGRKLHRGRGVRRIPIESEARIRQDRCLDSPFLGRAGHRGVRGRPPWREEGGLGIPRRGLCRIRLRVSARSVLVERRGPGACLAKPIPRSAGLAGRGAADAARAKQGSHGKSRSGRVRPHSSAGPSAGPALRLRTISKLLPGECPTGPGVAVHETETG
jgi:hypothetical protein